MLCWKRYTLEQEVMAVRYLIFALHFVRRLMYLDGIRAVLSMSSVCEFSA